MTVRVADELFPRACLHQRTSAIPKRTSAIPPALNSHKSGDLHGSAFAADRYGRPWELNVRASFWRPFLIALATCAGILSGPVGDLAYGQGRGRGQSTEGRGRGQALVSEGRGAGRQSALNRQLPRGYRNLHLLEDTGTDMSAGLPMAKPGNATTLPIASTIATATRAIPTRTVRATPIKATTAQDSDKATKKGTGKPPGNSSIT